ncbi:aminotransferase class V-fold PLP-dependent enzyme [Pseudidiomarina donghaiensis]|uniref:aminotransferase class V-fold PLP-dependent enzyme n=1 Tax=Pseudidiomarina donghaiensis TaxID=519452 RepID=UPI003A973E2E
MATSWDHDFAFLTQQSELMYLDSAATCQVPMPVLEAYSHYYRHQHANVHRASHRLGRAATTALENARNVFAKYVGAEAENIALMSSTTAALNGLAEQLPIDWQPGDEILLSYAEHHANILPWQRLAKRYKLHLQFISIDQRTGELGDWRTLLNARTKVVSITAASNVTGAVFDIKPLLAAAKAQGAITVVDAAQAAAHVPVNVNDLHCDALVFSMHKVYGVNGCAPLYLHPELWPRMQPFQVGGGIVQEVSPRSAQWVPSIQKFEAGSPNTAAAVAGATAIDWLTKQQPHQHLAQLRSQFVEQLSQRPWLTVLPAGDHTTPTVAFYSLGWQAFDIATWLDQHDIAVRAGHHCAQLLLQQWQLPAVVRVSFGAYNSAADISYFLSTLDAGWDIFSALE